MNIYEGFVFLLADHIDIRGLTLNQKFDESVNEEKEKRLSKEIEWKFKTYDVIRTNLNLVLIKDKADHLVKISIEYFYGAGYASLTIEDLKEKGVKITSHAQAD